MAAPSPGPDRWWLRLRAPTGPASPSTRRWGPTGSAAPSPGTDRLGGGPVRWRLRRRAHTCRHDLACPVRHRCPCTAPLPVCKVITLLHVRAAPTPVGKFTTFWHVSTKTGLCVFTTKYRAHGSISAAAAGRLDRNNNANLNEPSHVKCF